MKAAKMTFDDAKHAANENPRSFRTIREVPAQDMTVVEDRESGDRRFVARKIIIMHGLPVAFEMSVPGLGFQD
jgi:hypothetical protein